MEEKDHPVFREVQFVLSLSDEERKEYYRDQMVAFRGAYEMPGETMDEVIARVTACLRGHDEVLRKWREKKAG